MRKDESKLATKSDKENHLFHFTPIFQVPKKITAMCERRQKATDRVKETRQ
jgi:hypothetical protein